MDKKSSLYIILAAVLWGLIGLFSTGLSGLGLSSGDIVFVRAVGSAVTLCVAFLIKDRKIFRIRLRHIWYFIGTGILSFALFNWCYFTCMKECSLEVAVILLYTAPVFVVVLSALIFKERLTWIKLTALIMTAAGCCLVTGILGKSLHGTAFGILCGIGSGLFYGLYSIFGRFALKKYSSYTITVYTFLFASLSIIPLSAPLKIAGVISSPIGFLYAILIVLVSTVSPFLLYTKGLEKIESGNASILATIEPIVGVLISIFVIKDSSLTITNGAGIFLIISSVILLSKHK